MAEPDVEARLYTADEFQAIIRLPENERRLLELIEGAVVERTPYLRNTNIAARIGNFFNKFVIPRNLGHVSSFRNPGSYRLDNHNVYDPGAAFILKKPRSRLEALENPDAPDLAVEVIFPDKAFIDILKRVQRYILSGTRLVWLVYPDDRTVYVWKQGSGAGLNVEEFDNNATLTGGDVLPKFTLPVKDIFPD